MGLDCFKCENCEEIVVEGYIIECYDCNKDICYRCSNFQQLNDDDNYYCKEHLPEWNCSNCKKIALKKQEQDEIEEQCMALLCKGCIGVLNENKMSLRKA